MDTQTLQNALALLRPGDTIAVAAYFHEPRAFLAELHTAAAQVDNLSLWTSNVLGDYPIMGEACDRIHWLSSFYERHARAAHPRKQVTYYPSDLHATGAMMVEAQKPTVFAAAVPPMEPDGTYCISTSLQWEPECAAAADRIILEVNPAIPRADSPLRTLRSGRACGTDRRTGRIRRRIWRGTRCGTGRGTRRRKALSAGTAAVVLKAFDNDHPPLGS